MPAIANQRSVRNITRSAHRPEKLNILTFATHERYEENLCKTGHNFYSLAIGKTWDTDYAPIPDNYHIVNAIPDYVDFDLILTHTSCDRMFKAHQALTGLDVLQGNKTGIPILRHTHVLPDIRFDVPDQASAFCKYPSDKNSFISEYNMTQWNMSRATSASVVEHGVDTDFWKPDDSVKRDNVCLSVVNDWPNRDWCCGFNLWRQTTQDLPVRVFGKSPGFSEPANSTEHLREIYQSSRIFYNTSLHSPVPSVLLEAMSCGCAVVSTNNCMIPEIIENGKNGLVSNNPQELRGCLELLLKNQDLAKELGDNARKTIVEKYNLERFVNNWNNILHSTVNEYK
jgi:glycosyltransferase involved in cell wall biosynthesis|tara:strand:- start:3951 stop:4973 length:1023 start_codon:yes stop_codon:yes gene_type:complete